MRPTIIAGMVLTALVLTGCAHFPMQETGALLDDTLHVESEARSTHVAGWGETVVLPARHEPDPEPGPEPGIVDNHGPYVLDTGDRLRIFVYGEPNLSRLYVVDSEGNIAVPLIGNVRARGRTTRRLGHAITARLGARYVRDPKVTVDIHQSRPFYILGEVRNAGQYPFSGGITVEAAVAIAGGYTERADETAVRVTRRVNGNAEVFEVPPDFFVRPGDTILVRERFF